MGGCRCCVDLWSRQGQTHVHVPHPECAGHHDGRVTLSAGTGPVTAFGWLSEDGPPVAFARGPAPLARVGAAALDATATDPCASLAGHKAVAELLERYTAHLRPRTEMRYGTAAELATTAPSRCCPAEPRWWVRARSLLDGRPVSLPACRFVLASCAALQAPGCGDSTGLAVAPTRRLAVEAGLWEAVERAGVAQMAHSGPIWRLPTDMTGSGYAEALTRAGWTAQVVGCSFGGFAVAVCVASHPRLRRSVGGAAARTEATAASTAALAEAYVKSTAFVPRAVAATSSVGLLQIEDLWPELPDELPPAPVHRDPIEVLRRSALDAVAVDRGNPLLDALGWSAAQVVLRGPAPAPLAPGHPLQGLLR